MSKCRAKDPANCWYHAPNREQVIHTQHTAVQNMYNNVLNTYLYLSQRKSPHAPEYLNEFLRMSKLKDESEVFYYGTEKGETELDGLKETTEDYNELLRLEHLQTLAKQTKEFMETHPEKKTPVFPAHEAVFTFPAVETKTNKLSQPVETIGNKYNPTHTPQRVRTFIANDIKRAQKLGFIPRELKYKVEYKHKTGEIISILETDDVETARKVKKIVASYNKQTFNPETGAVTEQAFNGRVVKRIVQEETL